MTEVNHGLIPGFRPIAIPATLDHTFLMLASLFGRCIGLSAVVCVLLLFFFPLPHGNFQSTHGPVTDLRSKRAFLVLAFSILRACFRFFAARFFKLKMSFERFLRSWSSRTGIPEFACSLAVLRC